jgi:ribulose-5-phosphate 4-epimerase/fuculose-1-phosphate aldolase
MAHELISSNTGTTVDISGLDSDAIWEARVDMAAALRMSAHLGMNEAIDNHYSAMVPGRDDIFIVNPYGYSFHEITASKMLICDFDGNVLVGEGKPEASAFWIHARLHKLKPHIRAPSPSQRLLPLHLFRLMLTS